MLSAQPILNTVREEDIRPAADVCPHGAMRYAAKLCGPEAPERTELEQFIRVVFRRAYGARIHHFMPQLMSLRDATGRLLAVCGLRHAEAGPLFLESYLTRPIEDAIGECSRQSVTRADIVEVGNLAVAEPGIAQHLLASVSHYLHGTHAEWAVFTAIPVLRNSLARLNMPLEVLAEAGLEAIPPEERPDWGSYYDKRPQVIAVRRVSRPEFASA